MTTAQGFCPTCGASTPTDGLGERGLCRSCYLEDNALVRVPDTLSLLQCNGCNSIEIDGEWVDTDDDRVQIALEQITDQVEVLDVVEELTWEARTEPIDDTTLEVTAIFDLAFDGGWERRERTIEVSFEGTYCRRCSRIAGDDFGAIVQLRATDRTPVEDEITRAREITATVLDRRVEAGDRDSFLTDALEPPEGLDLRLSTPRLGEQVARAIQRDLGGTITTARTLVTEDSDGQAVYRVTFTLRLGPFRRGDILRSDERVLLVKRGERGLDVLDLETGEGSMVEVADLDATRVATSSDATAVTVVAQLDDRALQVLHPVTYEAVTVSFYDGIDPDAETVLAIDIDGQVYLLPDDVR